jgi:hypothetical protein
MLEYNEIMNLKKKKLKELLRSDRLSLSFCQTPTKHAMVIMTLLLYVVCCLLGLATLAWHG